MRGKNLRKNVEGKTEDEIRTLMTMRIMESQGDVMLGTCRWPNSEEALARPVMLLRGMTNCYRSDPSGEVFGTRGRQGGFQSLRYSLHFREPRWQMRRVYVGLTPGGSYLARE